MTGSGALGLADDSIRAKAASRLESCGEALGMPVFSAEGRDQIFETDAVIGSSGSVWRQTDVVIGRHGRRDAVKIFLRAGLQRFDVVHKVAVFRFKVERV